MTARYYTDRPKPNNAPPSCDVQIQEAQTRNTYASSLPNLDTRARVRRGRRLEATEEVEVQNVANRRQELVEERGDGREDVEGRLLSCRVH